MTETPPTDLPGLIAAWSGMLPLLAELPATPQDPEWHGEGSVSVHTGMVLGEARRTAAAENLTPDESLTLQTAAVLHDIGKPLTTRTRTIGGHERIVSPRHAEAGRNWLALRLPELGLPADIAREVLALTGFHHHPRRLVQDDAPAVAWRLLARQCSPRMVYLLEQADLRGRICPDLAAQLEIMELFRLRCEELELWRGGDPWESWRAAIDDAFPGRREAFRRHALQAGVHDAETGIIRSVEEAVARAWNLRDPAPELTVLCGPSGAGKSTWITRHRPEAAVISLDRLREQIAGKRADQSSNGQVIQAAKDELKSHLRRGDAMVWDATSLRADMRGWVVRLGMDYGARVTIAALQTPVSVLLARNRKREHPVPSGVLEKQIAALEWPDAGEAHEVVTIPYVPER